MLIRSSHNALFVVLRNGLTLEVSYDVTPSMLDAAEGGYEGADWRAPRSQGVWMFREEVLVEVTVGQA